MSRRHLMALGLALALVTLGLASWLFWGGPAVPALGAATPLPSIEAELFYLDAGAIVRRGSPRALVLRFSGKPEFVPYHFKHDGLSAPRTIEEWAAHLNAPVVFNAGQFDEKLDYLGWLKRDGEWLSRAKKGPWKGLLVSGPLDGAVFGRIVDLDYAEAEIEKRYRHVVQSMMLIDAEHKVRVRDSELTACRTVVAEDERGRILVLVTEGATTLGDLARWLPRAPLGVVRAMNLDGGVESQVAVRTPELTLAFYGQHGTGTTGLPATPGQIRYPLPAVVAVRPGPVPTL